MMGLLDYGSDITDDPRQLGLLSLGLRLMSTPGKFGQALGTAGQGALGDMQRAKQAAQEQQQAKLRDQMLRMQIQQSQAQQAQQAEALRQKEQFRQSLLADVPSPLGQANAVAAQAGPLGSKAAAAAQPQIDPMQVLMRRALETGQMDPMDFVKAQQKDATPIKLGAGEQLLAPGTYKPLATNQKAPTEESRPELLRLIAARDALPEGDPSRAPIEARIKMLGSHAPGATAISYGSPVPITLPGGGVGYAQPGNRPGAQPQMMLGPDGKPMKKPGEDQKNLTEDQGKATSWLERMNQAEGVILKAKTADLTSVGSSSALVGAAIDTIPFVGESGAGKAARNYVETPGRQAVRTAQEAWVAGLLRSDTGAAYKDMEKDDILRTFFPQPGEDKRQTKLKADLREGVKRAMQVRAGPGAERLDKVPKSGGLSVLDQADAILNGGK